MEIRALNSYGSVGSIEDKIKDFDVNQFFKIMIAKLENQDPLQPMSDADFLNQMAAISQTENLRELTLAARTTSKQDAIARASQLIGKIAEGVGEQSGRLISGVVTEVVSDSSGTFLRVGNDYIKLENVERTYDLTGNDTLNQVSNLVGHNVVGLDSKDRETVISGTVLSVQATPDDVTLQVQTNDGLKSISVNEILSSDEQDKNTENLQRASQLLGLTVEAKVTVNGENQVISDKVEMVRLTADGVRLRVGGVEVKVDQLSKIVRKQG